MTKEEIIQELWENSGHGTRRSDIEAAYNAGVAAEQEKCAKVCESEWSTVAERIYGEECAAAIRAMGQA